MIIIFNKFCIQSEIFNTKGEKKVTEKQTEVSKISDLPFFNLNQWNIKEHKNLT